MGHIDGDDFVLLLKSQDLSLRVRAAGCGVDAILGELSPVKTTAKARSGDSCLILNEAGLHDLLSQGAAPDGASPSLRRWRVESARLAEPAAGSGG